MSESGDLQSGDLVIAAISSPQQDNSRAELSASGRSVEELDDARIRSQQPAHLRAPHAFSLPVNDSNLAPSPIDGFVEIV